jgi:hypothetical protein
VDKQQRRCIGLAIFHDVHVTIGKRHEPVVSVPIARGIVL